MTVKGADLFAADTAEAALNNRPLAALLRPKTLDDIVGQDHLLGSGAPLRRLLESGNVPSMIFWGPPGTGKTTLANLVALHSKAHFLTLSAVMSGVKEVRNAVQQAQLYRQSSGQNTILFIDEIHRFNKTQQDALLPHVEDGTLTLIGATTENPSFEVNSALLSRSRVFVLKALTNQAIEAILSRAIEQIHGSKVFSNTVEMPESWLSQLVNFADGDGRKALGALETVMSFLQAHAGDESANDTHLQQLLGGGTRRFDKQGDQFYDQISALHKAVRGSDPDGAIYWFCRMLDGGCDPHYLARRILRMSVEDIGLADPRAQQICLQAWQSFDRLGSPEGELSLAQAVIYLACCAKSNAVYSAYNQARAVIEKTGSLEVPLAIRNAPSKLMKDLNYGAGYQYDHDAEDGVAYSQRYLPDELTSTEFYQRFSRGLEQKIAARLSELRQKRAKAQNPTGND